MIWRSAGIGIATMILVACGAEDPNLAANEAVVELHASYTTASEIADPKEKQNRLQQVYAQFLDVAASYPQSNVAVEILSDRPVAGLSRSLLEAEINNLNLFVSPPHMAAGVIFELYFSPQFEVLRYQEVAVLVAKMDLRFHSSFAECALRSEPFQSSQLFLEMTKAALQASERGLSLVPYLERRREAVQEQIQPIVLRALMEVMWDHIEPNLTTNEDGTELSKADALALEQLEDSDRPIYSVIDDKLYYLLYRASAFPRECLPDEYRELIVAAMKDAYGEDAMNSWPLP